MFVALNRQSLAYTMLLDAAICHHLPRGCSAWLLAALGGSQCKPTANAQSDGHTEIFLGIASYFTPGGTHVPESNSAAGTH